MKRTLLFLVLGAIAAFAGVSQQDPPEKEGKSPPPNLLTRKSPLLPAIKGSLHAFVEAPRDALVAVARGVEWLSEHQNPDGSYGDEYPVTVTALSCLALMGEGSHVTRGPYAVNVRDGLDYILKRQWRSGLIAEDRGKMMHSHGYATLFLAEVHGMAPTIGGCDAEELKARLKNAVRTIEHSQSHNGGWYYDPVPSYDEGSVTVTVVQALRAARNAGIKVRRQTVDKAIEYIKLSAVEDGGISYSLGATSTSFALTAAGISVLNYLGEYSGKEVEKGLAYLGRGFAKPDDVGKGNFPYYEEFYAALAIYHAGGEYWTEYYPLIRDGLVQRQNADGSWDSPYGKEYGTAFALLTLEIPCRYLSIFQK